jgi:hypothetical protein
MSLMDEVARCDGGIILSKESANVTHILGSESIIVNVTQEAVNGPVQQ